MLICQVGHKCVKMKVQVCTGTSSVIAEALGTWRLAPSCRVWWGFSRSLVTSQMSALFKPHKIELFTHPYTLTSKCLFVGTGSISENMNKLWSEVAMEAARLCEYDAELCISDGYNSKCM